MVRPAAALAVPPALAIERRLHDQLETGNTHSHRCQRRFGSRRRRFAEQAMSVRVDNDVSRTHPHRAARFQRSSRRHLDEIVHPRCEVRVRKDSAAFDLHRRHLNGGEGRCERGRGTRPVRGLSIVRSQCVCACRADGRGCGCDDRGWRCRWRRRGRCRDTDADAQRCDGSHNERNDHARNGPAPRVRREELWSARAQPRGR